MSEFGHFNPLETPPDPFLVEPIDVWSDPVLPDPFDEPLPDAWDDEEET